MLTNVSHVRQMLIDMMILQINVPVKMVIMIMELHFVYHVIGDAKHVKSLQLLVFNVKERTVILLNLVCVMTNFMKWEQI